MIEFQISTKHTGTYRRIKVFVYDTVDELKRASRKRDGFYGVVQDQGWYDQMAATTNSIQAYDVDEDGNEHSHRPYVTIRLSRDHLDKHATEIIAHESTHAALFLFRHDSMGLADLRDETTLKDLEDQEQLCYLVGDITRKVINKLYEKGVFA